MIAWSDLKVIRDVISVLATHGWQKSIDEGDTKRDDNDAETKREDPLAPVETSRQHFELPPKSAGVDVIKLHEELYDMLL